MYSVRGEIDQISTNTFRYTTCCAANVYMLVYILITALFIVQLLCREEGQLLQNTVKKVNMNYVNGRSLYKPRTCSESGSTVMLCNS